MKLKIPLALALASAIAITPGLAGPAHAAEGPANPSVSVEIRTAMESVGFDEEIAAANGFQIVTDANGVQSSIPVTNEAKQLVARYTEREGQVGALRAVSYGPCGYSTINLVTMGFDYLTIGTSFSVNLPVQTRWWGVVGFSGSGTFNVSFNGGASGPFWTGASNVRRAGGGWGQVAVGSYVIKVDGNICWSGSPSEFF